MAYGREVGNNGENDYEREKDMKDDGGTDSDLDYKSISRPIPRFDSKGSSSDSSTKLS